MAINNLSLDHIVQSFFGPESYQLEAVKSGQVNQTYIIKKDNQFIGVLRKTNKSIENINFENKIIESLVKRNFPTPAMIRLQNGASYLEKGETKYQAFQFVRGTPLTKNHTNPMQLYEIGKSLGMMHQIIANLNLLEEPEFEEFGRFQSIKQRFRWEDYIRNEILQKFQNIAQSDGKEIVTRSKRALEDSIQEIDTIYTNLPKQPIHADYTRENLLFDQSFSKIAGVIDFDDSHVDPRIFDPVVAAFNFSLQDSQFSLDQASYLLKGYKYEVRESSTILEEEIAAIPKLTKMYALFATLRMISQFNKNPNQNTLMQVQEYDTILQSTEIVPQKQWEEIY